MLYFTDSGPQPQRSGPHGWLSDAKCRPLGETSLQNPRGSVFAISPSTQLPCAHFISNNFPSLELPRLIPLCLNTLAHPCGVALSPDEKNIYARYQAVLGLQEPPSLPQVAETAMNRGLLARVTDKHDFN